VSGANEPEVGGWTRTLGGIAGFMAIVLGAGTALLSVGLLLMPEDDVSRADSGRVTGALCLALIAIGLGALILRAARADRGGESVFWSVLVLGALGPCFPLLFAGVP